MRGLFNVDADGNVVVLPQALLLEKFKVLQDKYKDKKMAIVELGLIYFAADYRSDFSSTLDIEDRVTKIKNNLYLHRKIKIDASTYAAIDFYIENQDTVTIKLLRSINNGLLRTIDLIDSNTMTDMKDIKDFTDVVTKLPAMVASMTDLEKIIKKGEAADSDTVGSGEKSIYEDL